MNFNLTQKSNNLPIEKPVKSDDFLIVENQSSSERRDVSHEINRRLEQDKERLTAQLNTMLKNYRDLQDKYVLALANNDGGLQVQQMFNDQQAKIDELAIENELLKSQNVSLITKIQSIQTSALGSPTKINEDRNCLNTFATVSRDVSGINSRGEPSRVVSVRIEDQSEAAGIQLNHEQV